MYLAVVLIARVFKRVISLIPQTHTLNEGKLDWPHPWERINSGLYNIYMDDDDDELFVYCQGRYK